MRKISVSVLATLCLLFVLNCSNNDDGNSTSPPPQSLEIEDFIWKGLNLFYFWQANVPDLADSRFATQDELNTFLNATANPESLFEDLLFDPINTDKYSWIVDDFIALEQQFQGVSKSNGVDFGLVRLSGSDDVFGYVRYILPNSNASGKDIQRGDLFLEVDGQPLTVDNFRDLLFADNDTYTLGFASIDNGIISLTGETLALTKEEFTENPIFITKSFDISGQKIGYLMYNAFTSNFDNELNDAIALLKADGITDLILDLRYNGGGSVRSATQLSSMITGQFNGNLFTREHWNAKLQEAFEDQNPAALINNFTDELSDGTAINSLNLSQLYVLISGSSASASELVINGLKPYIDVKLIGTQTEGKYVASITLYDSDNFARSGANPNHFYAMQPIVLEELNANDFNDKDGFDPDIFLEEDFENLGILGDENEPLLQRALSDITGVTKPIDTKKSQFSGLEKIGDSKSSMLLYKEMYIEKELHLNKAFFIDANR